MLVDIEMPRMDGFDLTRNVRGDPRTHGHPDHHHLLAHGATSTAARPRELGVNAFLGKPYQESELLQQIAALRRSDEVRDPRARSASTRCMREIGSGATSKVYLARDPFADRDVAIKVFLFDKQADAAQERMMHKAFVAEASLAGKLNHPHIVDIFDAVVEPDRSYLVMEYVPGTTLEAHADVVDAAAGRQGGRDHLQVHPRARVRLPARRDPSRHQARQHPALAVGRDQGERLRRLVPAAAAGDHADQRHRLAGLHVARADPHGAAQRTRPTSIRSA